MVDGRLPNQPARMYEQYTANRYIFVEVGTLADLTFVRKHDRNWIYSKFGEIENFECQFREYNDMEDLALKLYWLDLKLGTERVRRDVEIRLYNKTVGQKVMRQFKGLGKKGEAMLVKMSTLKAVLLDIMENEGEQLAEIHGIAPLPKGKILSDMKLALTELHA